MAKAKKNEKVQEEDLDAVTQDVVMGDDQADDDTLYTMGDILISDADTDEGGDEDQKILSQGSSQTASADDEDDTGVWVDSVDVFSDDDDFLSEEDYDPDNPEYYDE